MSTILVLQRDAQSPPALIGEYLLEAGFALDTRRLDRGDPLPGGGELDRAAALVVLGIDAPADDPPTRGDEGAVQNAGGAIAGGREASRSSDQIDVLAEALGRGLPTLGVGHGAQQLVRAAGGDVFRRAELDLGWEPIEFAARDEFVRDVDPRPLVFSWRTHTCRLPDDALLLAESAAEPQIFRLGEAAWGVEFHPEVDRPLLLGWLDGAAGSRDGRRSERRDRLRAASKRELLRSAMLCGQLMLNFLTAGRVRER
jgi:GMP synthase (glutamine-hydrolysing)